jgi:Zn-dependent protease
MGQLPNMLYLASIWVIPVVIAVTFHEAAHGFVARFLGDETAWKLGRVSLNPIKHIDPFGTILLDLSATPQTLWVLVARG